MTRIAAIAGELQDDQVQIYDGESQYTGRIINVDSNLDEFTLETQEGYEWVTNVEAIDHLESIMYFEKTNLSKIVPNRFNTSEYQEDFIKPVVDEIKGSETQEFIPLTHKIPEDHYEIVDGHRTVNAFIDMDYEDVWTRILNPYREDSWIQIFAEDHFPELLQENHEPSNGTYTLEQVEESIDRMLEHFPEEYITKIPVIWRNMEKGEDKSQNP